MRFVTAVWIIVCLLLSNIAISQGLTSLGDATVSNPIRISSGSLLPLQTKQILQLQCSELVKLTSKANQMAAKEFNPRVPYENELIAALAVSSRQADILNQWISAAADLESLIQFVMLEALLGEQENLRDLLEEMQGMSKLKQQHRDLLESVKKQREILHKNLRAEMDRAPLGVRAGGRV